ncbi:MAG: hypothetical protein M3409_08825 [Gemmatimonadota bacterium]|jgi:hypothetical protein|nr:hypothetical protein [Gemmatimonadota bacterium]
MATLRTRVKLSPSDVYQPDAGTTAEVAEDVGGVRMGGLAPDTTYHFWIVHVFDGVEGEPLYCGTFRTAAVPPALTSISAVCTAPDSGYGGQVTCTFAVNESVQSCRVE